jgi:putative glycosyl hydrolase
MTPRPIRSNARLLALAACLALAAVTAFAALPETGAAGASPAQPKGHQARPAELDRKACGGRQSCLRRVRRLAADRRRRAHQSVRQAQPANPSNPSSPAKGPVGDHPGNGGPAPSEPGATAPTPPAEQPMPEPTPTPEGSEAPGLTVALDAGNYGMEGAEDVRGAVDTVRFDTELGAAALKNFQDAGLQIDMLFSGPYEEGGVCALDADQWVAEQLAFYTANTTPAQTPVVEALNEPGGSWFWGPEAGSVANGSCYRTLLQKLHDAFQAQYGEAAPKVLATIDGGTGGGLAFGRNWWTPSASAYVDGVVVHPYGGTSVRGISALGNRALVEGAHALTGEPVYITEIGWPTATGSPATGDSLQWSEAEQAQNLTEFIGWAASTPYVREVAYFNYRDFGKDDWYGVTRSDGSHKPSYYALREASATYDS